VFLSRALKSTFGATREEIPGRWRKLRNEESHNLNFLLGVISVIKTKRMEQVGLMGVI
jgi:hypothetical protein